MTLEEIEKHFAFARLCGREIACGKKIDYKREESADRAAASMNVKKARNNDLKALEAYPCPFCGGWHIGRKMQNK